MIIIRLRSGLGNQMFQYAFFLQMQKWYGEENVKLDKSTYHWKVHNGLELDKVFNIDLEKDSVPPSVSLKYADVGYHLQHRILRRIRGRRHHSYVFWKQLKLEDYKKLDEIYIEGYWNEEKYFAEVQDKVRQIYQFSTELTEADQALIENIQSAESVSVHVRRGDYKKFSELLPMCEPVYYQQAWERLSEIKNDLKFFIFSDDLAWCRKELDFLPNTVFVENDNKLQAFKDMMFMSKCKHNIIANSTFSWWGAWLNNNQDKSVIYPESTNLTYSSMPKDWICLK